MKILFVSTSFPPATDMHTTRNMYLVDGLVRNGHKVDIITCGEYEPKQLMFDKALSSLKIYRTDYPFIYKWHKYMTSHCRFKPLLKVHNVFVNYYAIPDMYSGWERLVMKIVKKYDLLDYDVVITSSGSYTAHFFGKKWKLLTGKKWIAEYGDPWGLDGYGNIKKLYYKLEQPILSFCDGLVFTTQSTIDAYKRNYKNSIPYELVTGGYNAIIDDIGDVSKNGIVFTYMGIAYKRDRNLGNVLSAIKNNNKTCGQIVGTISDDIIEECKSISNIICRGRVPYEESLNIMASSDVMIIVGNFGKLQIPGKTYIYLSSKKPILYIQQQEEEDPTLSLLSKFKGVIVCKNTGDSISKAIDEIVFNYDKYKKEAESRCEADLFKNYSWEALGNQFEKFTLSIVR